MADQQPTQTFTCENCDRVFPVTDQQPREIGFGLDDDDFGLWCSECVEREL